MLCGVCLRHGIVRMCVGKGYKKYKYVGYGSYRIKQTKKSKKKETKYEAFIGLWRPKIPSGAAAVTL